MDGTLVSQHTQPAETSKDVLKGALPSVTTWGYRVKHKVIDVRNGIKPIDHFTIIEAYYTEAGEIVAWCPAEELGETVDELRQDLVRMLQATWLPVIREAELPR